MSDKARLRIVRRSESERSSSGDAGAAVEAPPLSGAVEAVAGAASAEEAFHHLQAWSQSSLATGAPAHQADYQDL